MVIEKAKRLAQDIEFSVKRRGLLQAPGAPHLDEETLAAYNRYIPDASYMEFGAGGSTLIAAEKAKSGLVVESDVIYLDLVKEAVGERPNFHFYHANIGPTGPWGRPLLAIGGRAPLSHNYFKKPWQLAAELGHEPNFVFIDGRFRSACVFNTFVYAPEATVLVDDFVGREEYDVVLNFSEVVERPGKSIVLRRADDFDEERWAPVIGHFPTYL
ncbi:MAG: hypothetical protein AAGG79_07830 [Pseudomonadota bacterium]